MLPLVPMRKVRVRFPSFQHRAKQSSVNSEEPPPRNVHCRRKCEMRARRVTDKPRGTFVTPGRLKVRHRKPLCELEQTHVPPVGSKGFHV